MSLRALIVLFLPLSLSLSRVISFTFDGVENFIESCHPSRSSFTPPFPSREREKGPSNYLHNLQLYNLLLRKSYFPFMVFLSFSHSLFFELPHTLRRHRGEGEGSHTARARGGSKFSPSLSSSVLYFFARSMVTPFLPSFPPFLPL